MLTDVLLLFGLIVLNGVFAMSEIALVSSRRARLARLAERGDAGAVRALELAKDPTRFLSTVQVGITSIGILSGAFGEVAVAERVEVWLQGIPLLAPYAQTLALLSMVVVLTYVSLIIGELVPKRLGLTNPERIAALVARPMSAVATIGRPVVFVLTRSTVAVLALLRLSRVKAPSVTPEEIRVLMAEGAQEGVFHPAEQTLVANVMHLDERQAGAVLTPRSDVVFLDLDRPFEANRETMASSPHSVLPACRGGLDEVVGFVRSSDVLAALLRAEPIDLATLALPPLFVPRTVSLMALLQQFKQTRLPLALVVDEFGSVVGLVSLTDVTAAIIGDVPTAAEGTDPDLVERADGSLLVDGGFEIERLVQRLGSRLYDESHEGQYHTLGGLAMSVLGRVPRVGDAFERDGHRFEVVDMDGNRVDRVLVVPAARRVKAATS
jgi:putative hemolysin